MSTDFANTGPIPVTVYPLEYPAEVRIPASAYNWEGFRAWALSDDYPNRGSITFVGGELIIDMSPESIENHNFIKIEITAAVYRLVRELKLGRVFADRALLSNPFAKVSNEPDATFASFATLNAGRCQITQSNRQGIKDELVGCPDWVLEVVSTTSRRKDNKLLRDAYFNAGIPEYWIVDALGDKIDFQILMRSQTAYEPVEPRDGWLRSSVFSRSFQLTRRHDEDGLWQYTLGIKE